MFKISENISRLFTSTIVIVFFTILLTGNLFRDSQGFTFYAACILITLICYSRATGFTDIGLGKQTNILRLLAVGTGLGILLTGFDFFILQPFSTFIFNETYNPTSLVDLRDDINLLFYYLSFGWFAIAFSEEYIFRGFFLNEFKKIFGASNNGLLLSILFTSIIVGLLHFGLNTLKCFLKLS